MSRRTTRTSVSVTAEVDVDIEEFGDAIILEYACTVAERLNSHEADPREAAARDSMGRLARILGVNLLQLPPASTASTITSMDALKAWQAEQNGKAH